MNLHTKGLIPSISESGERVGSQQRVFLASDLDIGKHLEWGVEIRCVDRIPSQQIDDYWELNSRLAWRPTRNCELALIGRGLLDLRHREHAQLVISLKDVEVERAVYLK